VHITAELLVTGGVRRKMLVGDMYNERLKAFVIDEAHTVKKWYISSQLLYSIWLNKYEDEDDLYVLEFLCCDGACYHNMQI
jgi:hypothetical protein